MADGSDSFTTRRWTPPMEEPPAGSTADKRARATPRSNDLVTEDEAALRFAERYSGKFRYCHDHGAWFQWTGSIWKQNGTGLAFHYARELARQIADGEADKVRTVASKAAFAGAV